jgi:mediator of RNA polymerase II transcription subunit 14
METAVNGVTASTSLSPRPPQEPQINGVHETAITIEQLEQELPVVYDGQVPLGDLVSRVVQSIYAELSELAETWVIILY